MAQQYWEDRLAVFPPLVLGDEFRRQFGENLTFWGTVAMHHLLSLPSSEREAAKKAWNEVVAELEASSKQHPKAKEKAKAKKLVQDTRAKVPPAQKRVR